MSIEEPVKELQKTFFFRIVEQLFHKGKYRQWWAIVQLS